MTEPDQRFDQAEAVFTVEARGPISAEGFLAVSGEIGSRSQLLRAIDALCAAADRLWPKPQRRAAVPMPGDGPSRGGMSDDSGLMPIVEGRLVPLTWGVECPLCGETIEIEHVAEDDCGLFFADEIDTAPDCPTCKVCVATLRVEIKAHAREGEAA